MNKYFIRLCICFFIGAGLSACHKTPKYDNPVPLVLVPDSPTSQWTRINNLPAENITALEVFGNTIYAASSTSDKVFESSDNGATWSSTNLVSSGLGITAIAVFKNRLYVGTDVSNVYSSPDNGKTWANEGNNTYSVLSFAVWNDNLYAAAIDNSGHGLLMMQAPGQWATFQNGLDNTVRASKVMVVNNYFIAAATDYFTAYNPAQQLWQTKPYVDISKTVYKNTPFPNLVIDMAYSQNSIFAQIYVGNNDQESILRSDDNGLSMHFDTVGLKADTADDKYLMRGLYAGNNKIYSIIDQEKGTKGTWLQSRDQNAVLGSTWATGEEFLPGIQAHALRSSANVLFLATDNGLYFKKVL